MAWEPVITINHAPGVSKFQESKPFITRITKESLCTIRLFLNTEMLTSVVLIIVKIGHHSIVAMIHTQLSMVSK